MGLLGGMARVAAATAVSNRVTRRQSERWAAQGQGAPAYMAPSSPAQPEMESAAPDPIEQLRELGELHEQGVLTDDEFATQKAKLLA